MVFAVLFTLLLVGSWQVSAREIPVLMYHFVDTKAKAAEDPLIVSKETLAKQLSWLEAWRYRALPLDEFYAIRTGERKGAGRSVVLTFDDGNKDFYERVFPLASERQVAVAAFLISGHLQNGEQGSMTVDQARFLARSPLVTLGAHTETHRELVGLNSEELEREVTEAKKRLERLLGSPVLYFSYPSGRFDTAGRQKVKDAGFRMAFSTSWKNLRGRNEDLYSLTRIKITEKDANPVRFWFKVSGMYSAFLRARQALGRFLHDG